MFDPYSIAHIHDEATARWHETRTWPDDPTTNGLGPELHPELLNAILANHRANFDLWHEEDKAREPGASDAFIASVKRAIDVLNQQRNDLVEEMDRVLLRA